MIERLLAKWSARPGRERVLFGVVLAACLFLFIQRVVVYPVLSYHRGMEEKIRLKEKEVERNEKYLAMKPALAPAYRRFLEAVRPLGNEEEKIGEMLKDLERLGSESEITVANIKPRPAKDEAAYRILSADVEAECIMTQLLAFLHKLESEGQIYWVSKFKMRPHEKGAEGLRANLVLSRAFLKETPIAPESLE